jgi:pSer/pThr/pTyr-binding forkhead associated (FHA) protein
VYHFNVPVVLIGRDEHCDCSIQHPTVSAQHARLAFHHNQWWVEDLHSTNGTFLNQSPVDTSMVLTLGDELRCGQVVLTVILGGGN